MHVEVRRDVLVDRLEELQKPIGAVALVQRADHLPVGDVQRGIEAGGAVALIVVRRSLGRAGKHRQCGRGAVECLDLALLIHAEHDGPLGWDKYRPQMSWTFSISKGSLESFQVSWRWGCNPKTCQIRITASGVIPISLAIERVDQCVAFFGALSKVLVTTRSTRSSVIVRGLPGRGSSARLQAGAL